MKNLKGSILKKGRKFFVKKVGFKKSGRELLKSNIKLERITLFCPSCESESISITIKKNIAEAKCPTCSITERIKKKNIYEPIDIYGDFVDLFNADKEIQKLLNRILELKNESKYEIKKDNKYSSEMLCYSKILDISRTKTTSLELLLEDKDYVDMDDKDKWKLKLEKYKKLEKEAEDELERENKIFEKSLFTESDKDDIKEEEDNDIFSDPGFLDF